MLFRKCSSGKPSHNIGVFFNTIDPTATLAVQCGNGFHGYQCARLNRYDAVT
jgi:hypothetical protein